MSRRRVLLGLVLGLSAALAVAVIVSRPASRCERLALGWLRACAYGRTTIDLRGFEVEEIAAHSGHHPEEVRAFLACPFTGLGFDGRPGHERVLRSETVSCDAGYVTCAWDEEPPADVVALLCAEGKIRRVRDFEFNRGKPVALSIDSCRRCDWPLER